MEVHVEGRPWGTVNSLCLWELVRNASAHQKGTGLNTLLADWKGGDVGVTQVDYNIVHILLACLTQRSTQGRGLRRIHHICLLSEHLRRSCSWPQRLTCSYSAPEKDSSWFCLSGDSPVTLLACCLLYSCFLAVSSDCCFCAVSFLNLALGKGREVFKWLMFF